MSIVMLAHVYKNQDPRGYWASLKMDGMRAFWDGGITIGHAAAQVPFARKTPGRENEISTGLWSRYGNVIFAPDWWTNKLPLIPLDGELMALGGFQNTISVVRSKDFNAGWNNVAFHVFDSPPPRLFGLREEDYGSGVTTLYDTFPVIYDRIQELEGIVPVRQTEIKSVDQLAGFFDGAVSLGYEGVMLRNPRAMYQIKRSHNLLKIKPTLDTEGVVTGYRAGKGKYQGMLGSLIVDGRFDLSGMDDTERTLNEIQSDWAYSHPGEEIPVALGSAPFVPLNSVITYKYRTLTDAGIPREARFEKIKVHQPDKS